MKPIGDASREFRGRHMVESLTTLVSRGERVVAVVGGSHVIRQEPTLRSVITKDPSVSGESLGASSGPALPGRNLSIRAAFWVAET